MSLPDEPTLHWIKNETTLKLIEEYKKKQELWHSDHLWFKCNKKRDEALSDLARIMNIERLEVERKLKNLVCHNLREFRRESQTKDSKNPYVSKWFAYPAMEFLRERFFDDKGEIIYKAKKRKKGTKRRFSNTNTSSRENVFVSGSECDANDVPDSMGDPLIDTNTESHTQSVSMDPQQLAAAACTSFGNYVAAKLLNLPPYLRSTAEFKIQKILFDYDMMANQEEQSTDLVDIKLEEDTEDLAIQI